LGFRRSLGNDLGVLSHSTPEGPRCRFTTCVCIRRWRPAWATGGFWSRAAGELYVQPAREASAPVAERKQFRCERGRAAAQIARAAVERVDTQLARRVDP